MAGATEYLGYSAQLAENLKRLRSTLEEVHWSDVVSDNIEGPLGEVKESLREATVTFDRIAQDGELWESLRDGAQSEAEHPGNQAEDEEFNRRVEALRRSVGAPTKGQSGSGASSAVNDVAEFSQQIDDLRDDLLSFIEVANATIELNDLPAVYSNATEAADWADHLIEILCAAAAGSLGALVTGPLAPLAAPAAGVAGLGVGKSATRLRHRVRIWRESRRKPVRDGRLQGEELSRQFQKEAQRLEDILNQEVDSLRGLELEVIIVAIQGSMFALSMSLKDVRDHIDVRYRQENLKRQAKKSWRAVSSLQDFDPKWHDLVSRTREVVAALRANGGVFPRDAAINEIAALRQIATTL